MIESDGVGHRFKAALEAVHAVMAGYDHAPGPLVASLLACLDDQALALVQWNEEYGVVQSRLPAALAVRLETIAAECAWAVDSAQAAAAAAPPGENGAGSGSTADAVGAAFCGQFIEALEAAVAGTEEGERAALAAMVEPLLEVARAHAEGKEAFARRTALQVRLEAWI